MDFKQLFLRIWRMCVVPRLEWEDIQKESPRRDVGTSFVFPFVALSGLAVLLGRLLRDGINEGAWLACFSEACVVSIALLATFWLTAWAANELRVRYLGMESDMPVCFQLTGYAMAVIFTLTIFTGLFVELALFRYVLQVYVVYVVWLGVDELMKVDEDRRMTYSIIVSAMLIFVPFLFRFIFDKLSAITV